MRETRWRTGVWRRSAYVMLACATLAACSDSGPTDEGQPVEDAELVMAANLAGANIATLVVRVTAADIPSTLVFNLTIDEGGMAFGTIKVPPGVDRLITVQAFDALGIITHEGAALVTVNPGNNPPVFIALVPRSGHIPLQIQMGDIFVSVGGETTGIPGDAIQLTAFVYSAFGFEVDAEVEWASDNPAIATVDQNGLVSLLIPGTVRIYALAGGYSGNVQITVLNAGTGLIQGAVYNAFTGMPVQFTDITVDGVPYATVDQFGQFSFQIAAGTYQIGAAPWIPECNPPANQEVTVAEGDAVFVYFAIECNAAPSNNETGAPHEADYCIVIPATLNILDGETINLYGQVYEAGLTDVNFGDTGAVLQQFGFGEVGTDPMLDGTWQWGPGSFNIDVGNNDEYGVAFETGGGFVGQTAYAFRVSLDGGASWTYCDGDGAGSDTGLDFSAAQVGVLTIN